MPGTVAPHSHRPTTKLAPKAFKSRKATKNAVRDLAKGKAPSDRRKTPHQQAMSKLDRRNQNRQRQLEKQKERRQESSIFSGRDAAPRNVAVIPLCTDCDTAAAIGALNRSLDIESEILPGCNRVSVDRFKQRLQYLPVSKDLTTSLDAARAADFVVFVLSANEEVDDLGELILRSVESQGLSNLFTVVHGLGGIEPAKQRLSVLESLKSYMRHFHPDQEKLYSLDSRQECSNLMRSLCSTTPKGVRWRDERSWMLAEEVKLAADGTSMVVTGVVRGKPLNADRLVQVGDWGAFQINKITAAPLTLRKPKSNSDMTVDDDAPEETLGLPGVDRDDLADLAPEEISMSDPEDGNGDVPAPATTSVQKGVLLDDHHYFSENEEDEASGLQQPKRLPKGTSSYQSAWFLGDEDVSDSGSDLEDFEMQDAEPADESGQPEDGMEGVAGDAQTEAGPSEYPQSEMFVEPNEDDDAKQLEAYRSKRRDEAQDDMEFPDEIELHPDVLARERFIRYRGLKSLRTSPWNEEGDRPHEPEGWRRLLRIADYQASRVRSAREALVGGVAPGKRVSVYLKDLPSGVAEAFGSGRPLTLVSLLRHEHKQTALNFLINLGSDHPTSIKSKEELIVQCGPRRFVINPLFSQGGNTPNDVHKYCRYLHPGQSAIATFVGPVTWGPVPVLYFKRTAPTVADSDDSPGLPLKLIATGTALPPSTSRVVAKRVVLTGHPYHIHKKIVTVRYMFFNREDVDWFKVLPLWTKRGRSGYIKETLGTHGYFKATFDGRINPQDAIGVSLYKRVWPRNSALLQGPLMDGSHIAEGVADEGQMDAEVA